LGALALTAELQRRNHALTPWGHESSPFVS
jgi:hypothetical protein